MNISRIVSTLIATFAFAYFTAPAMAQTCRTPLPPPLNASDDAFFKLAANSTDPQLWVKYFLSTGCVERRAVVQNLFYPILKLPSSAKILMPPAPNDPTLIFAPDRLRYYAKFSGDQSQRIYEAKNDGFLDGSGTGGWHIYHFQVISQVKVKNIPAGLLTDPTWPKDVALWIEYQCGSPGGGLGQVFGKPGTTPGICSPAGGTFDKMKFTLKGPYQPFFQLTATCAKDAFTGDCEGSTPGDQIHGVTLTLTPKLTFLGLLSDSHLQVGAASIASGPPLNIEITGHSD